MARRAFRTGRADSKPLRGASPIVGNLNNRILTFIYRHILCITEAPPALIFGAPQNILLHRNNRRSCRDLEKSRCGILPCLLIIAGGAEGRTVT
jgi:hypothetical protein